ncbi:Jerky -like protein-like [Trichinella sp. T6]|nr:Jerky -like protein-like [Trichinella sp. T6]
MYSWFLQKRAHNQPISGTILQKNALPFSIKLGWLRNFKSRHSIREFEIHGKKLSADSESAALINVHAI